jgi:hypothetical protein
VEVDVEVEGVAEALHEGDGAALPAAHAPLPAGAAAERGEDGADEEAEDGRHEARIGGIRGVSGSSPNHDLTSDNLRSVKFPGGFRPRTDPHRALPPGHSRPAWG